MEGGYIQQWSQHCLRNCSCLQIASCESDWLKRDDYCVWWGWGKPPCCGWVQGAVDVVGVDSETIMGRASICEARRWQSSTSVERSEDDVQCKMTGLVLATVQLKYSGDAEDKMENTFIQGD